MGPAYGHPFHRQPGDALRRARADAAPSQILAASRIAASIDTACKARLVLGRGPARPPRIGTMACRPEPLPMSTAQASYFHGILPRKTQMCMPTMSIEEAGFLQVGAERMPRSTSFDSFQSFRVPKMREPCPPAPSSYKTIFKASFGDDMPMPTSHASFQSFKNVRGGRSRARRRRSPRHTSRRARRYRRRTRARRRRTPSRSSASSRSRCRASGRRRIRRRTERAQGGITEDEMHARERRSTEGTPEGQYRRDERAGDRSGAAPELWRFVDVDRM